MLSLPSRRPEGAKRIHRKWTGAATLSRGAASSLSSTVGNACARDRSSEVVADPTISTVNGTFVPRKVENLTIAFCDGNQTIDMPRLTHTPCPHRQPEPAGVLLSSCFSATPAPPRRRRCDATRPRPRDVALRMRRAALVKTIIPPASPPMDSWDPRPARRRQ